MCVHEKIINMVLFTSVLTAEEYADIASMVQENQHAAELLFGSMNTPDCLSKIRYALYKAMTHKIP
jgi:hypothetical protein